MHISLWNLTYQINAGYMVFAVLNTLIYCFPARWAWNTSGFLGKLGFYDFAGGCIVHVSGGASALIAAWMLGPRFGRFANGFNDEIRYQLRTKTSIYWPIPNQANLVRVHWPLWLVCSCCGGHGSASIADRRTELPRIVGKLRLK